MTLRRDALTFKEALLAASWSCSIFVDCARRKSWWYDNITGNSPTYASLKAFVVSRGAPVSNQPVMDATYRLSREACLQLIDAWMESLDVTT